MTHTDEEKDLTAILYHEKNKDLGYEAVSPPIVQTSNFSYPDFASYAKASSDLDAHYVYTRGSNPTTKLLEEKLAALEGGEDAKVFGSGMGAISATLFSLLKAKDHVLVVNIVYGATTALLDTLQKFDVSFTQIHVKDTAEIQKSLQENTRMIYFESPSGQTFQMLDFKQIRAFAKQSGALTVIDNTWASPLFQNPIAHGIDVVIHSLSKYVGGHSDLVGGVVIGKKETLKSIHGQGQMMLGSTISPMNAWLAIRGLRTLAIRMREAHASIQAVVEALQDDARVRGVYHPHAATGAQQQIRDKQLQGYGSLFALDFVDEDFEKMRTFVDALRVFKIAVSWGGYESLILPSNRGYDDEKLRARGLSVSHVRLYVGLEGASVLLGDIKQALDVAYGEL